MSEIVSFLDLSIYPSIALIFFLAAFIAVVWNVMTKSKQEIEAAANIPLDDDVIFTPRVSSIESNTDTDSTDPVQNGGGSHA
ncbi:MAG: cbb3-type cytochrome c oxidase subunit 3 [Candidatus Marinimicrobia bacterium]|nr:cbb3-type cytochrome c oxidase subunit 3 [Candidatus Neomarinimicrobiota bacterium]